MNSNYIIVQVTLATGLILNWDSRPACGKELPPTPPKVTIRHREIPRGAELLIQKVVIIPTQMVTLSWVPAGAYELQVCTNPVAISVVLPGTNAARSGTGYKWYGLNGPSENANREVAPGINDGNTNSASWLIAGSSYGVDDANRFEAAGVVWTSDVMVIEASFHNGPRDASNNGVFAAGFRAQFTTNGANWFDAPSGWTGEAYPYNSNEASNRKFMFNGPGIAVRGVRFCGQVHTASDFENSWVGSCREVEAWRGGSVSNRMELAWTSLTNVSGSVIELPVDRARALLRLVRPSSPTNVTVTLAWDASPGTNVIANYNVCQGVGPRTYTNRVSAGTNLTVTLTNVPGNATNYFAATAVDTSGLESDYSNEVTLGPVAVGGVAPRLTIQRGWVQR